ncbi:MAG: AbrB/MazE/SpoVT family DNA-binding domain-containing protein [Oscillospiraceae bacterium]|nr:AbrB/MazE/SpoVT family DNA-binding domain-containing protein [Oscillospiraceae bacterium]
METTAKVSAWGGSIGIRIPKSVIEQIGISDKSTVSLKVLNGKELLVSPMPIKEKKTLAQLFEEYPGDYMNEEELDWGEPVGDEVW